MRLTHIICLIFTHYVCGGPSIVEKNTFLNFAGNGTQGNAYKHIACLANYGTPHITQPPKRIVYNKRFTKRYRKTQRVLTACLQSHKIIAGFCGYNTWQNIRTVNHPFHPWLATYLTLFALFRI